MPVGDRTHSLAEAGPCVMRCGTGGDDVEYTARARSLSARPGQGLAPAHGRFLFTHAVRPGDSRGECVTGRLALVVFWQACYRWISGARVVTVRCRNWAAAGDAGGFRGPGRISRTRGEHETTTGRGAAGRFAHGAGWRAGVGGRGMS